MAIFSDDEDRRLYLEFMREETEKLGVEILRITCPHIAPGTASLRVVDGIGAQGNRPRADFTFASPVTP